GRDFRGRRDDRGRDDRGARGGRDRRDHRHGTGRPGRGGRRPAQHTGRFEKESELSKAARERLRALRADYDPRDDDRPDPDRDTYADVPGGIRLQKALAAAGVASRRGGVQMIAAGRGRVDYHIVLCFVARFDLQTSEIRVDGMLVVGVPDMLYFALNMPRGFVSSMWDPEGRPTLADF